MGARYSEPGRCAHGVDRGVLECAICVRWKRLCAHRTRDIREHARALSMLEHAAWVFA